MTSRKTQRIPYIDGIRGYLIYALTISHLTGVIGSNIFEVLTHKPVSIFFSGEGFIFVSGLMMGYLFYLPLQENGLATSLAKSFGRSLKIFKYYVAVYLLCAATLIFVIPDTNTVLNEVLFKGIDPWSVDSIGLFLGALYRPAYFDILYLYIVLIALAPVFVYLLVKKKIFLLVSVSVFSWVMVQYGIFEKLYVLIDQKIDHDLVQIMGSFNLFSWQLLFIVGIFSGGLGFKYQDKINLISDFSRDYLLYACLAVLACFFLVSMLNMIGIISVGFVTFKGYLSMGPFTILNFICLVVVIFTLLASGDQVLNRSLRVAKNILVKIFTCRFFVVIGTNTLLTFSASVVFCYWVAAYEFILPNQLKYMTNSLLVIFILCLIYLVAIIDANRLKRKKAKLHDKRSAIS